MTATGVVLNRPDGCAEEVFFSACSNRAMLKRSDPVSERRADTSAAETFCGLISRLERYDIIAPFMAEAYRTVGQLIEQSVPHVKTCEGHNLQSELLVDVLDQRIHEKAQIYANQKSSEQWPKDQVLDLIRALDDSGFLSRTGWLLRGINFAEDKERGLFCNAALFEAALAIKGSLHESSDSNNVQSSPLLNNIFDSFSDTSLDFANLFFNCQLEGDSLRIKLPLKNSGGTNGSVEFAIKGFDKCNHEDYVKLYELVRRYSSDPQPTSLTDSAWFKMLSKMGELKELSNCVVNDGALFARSSEGKIRLSGVHFQNSTCSFDGAVDFQNVTFDDSRILFKACQGSVLGSTRFDKLCTVSGDLSSSNIGSDTELHGYAVNLKLQMCTWQMLPGESANKRMLGLIVNTQNVDQGFFDAIRKYRYLNNAEIQAKHFEMNQSFSGKGLVETLTKAGFEIQKEDTPLPDFTKDKLLSSEMPTLSTEAKASIEGKLVSWPRLDGTRDELTTLVPAGADPASYFVSRAYRGNLFQPDETNSPLPHVEAGCISLLVLRILEMADSSKPPFFGSTGNWRGEYQLKQPKSIDWPPPIKPDKPSNVVVDEDPAPAEVGKMELSNLVVVEEDPEGKLDQYRDNEQKQREEELASATRAREKREKQERSSELRNSLLAAFYKRMGRKAPTENQENNTEEAVGFKRPFITSGGIELPPMLILRVTGDSEKMAQLVKLDDSIFSANNENERLGDTNHLRQLIIEDLMEEVPEFSDLRSLTEPNSENNRLLDSSTPLLRKACKITVDVVRTLEQENKKLVSNEALNLYSQSIQQFFDPDQSSNMCIPSLLERFKPISQGSMELGAWAAIFTDISSALTNLADGLEEASSNWRQLSKHFRNSQDIAAADLREKLWAISAALEKSRAAIEKQIPAAAKVLAEHLDQWLDENAIFLIEICKRQLAGEESWDL